MSDADDKDRRRARHEVSRTVHFFGLLLAAIFAVNLFVYWERGTRLSLVVAGIALVALAGYLIYARRVLKGL